MLRLAAVPRILPGLIAPAPAPDDVLVIVRGLEVLVDGAKDGSRLPGRAEIAHLSESIVYLGTMGGRAWYGSVARPDAELPSGMRFASVRSLFAQLEDETLLALGYAVAIVEWDTMHRFCGRCAVATRALPEERARTCPRCDAVFHPRVAPAMIVLVEKAGRILLARGPHFPPRLYGAIAGFVETGESLEEAAAREVREEVGIEITNLRYFGSQPWPFGRSLMIAFFADYAGGELCPDAREIVAADWFALDELPELPPKLSIARRLIDAFVASRKT